MLKYSFKERVMNKKYQKDKPKNIFLKERSQTKKSHIILNSYEKSSIGKSIRQKEIWGWNGE